MPHTRLRLGYHLSTDLHFCDTLNVRILLKFFNLSLYSFPSFAIIKRIVEAHGGTIRATSQIGQGSCFTVCPPIVG